MQADPLVDQVRETRAKLVREHGGLRGWGRHLQETQRQRIAKKPQQPKTSDTSAARR